MQRVHRPDHHGTNTSLPSRESSPPEHPVPGLALEQLLSQAATAFSLQGITAHLRESLIALMSDVLLKRITVREFSTQRSMRLLMPHERELAWQELGSILAAFHLAENA